MEQEYYVQQLSRAGSPLYLTTLINAMLQLMWQDVANATENGGRCTY